MNASLETLQTSLEHYTAERASYTARRQSLTALFATVTDQARRETILANMTVLDNEVRACNEWIRTLTSHIKYYNS